MTSISWSHEQIVHPSRNVTRNIRIECNFRIFTEQKSRRAKCYNISDYVEDSESSDILFCRTSDQREGTLQLDNQM